MKQVVTVQCALSRAVCDPKQNITRAKFHEDDAGELSDIFSHEGNLNVYYVDDEQLDYLRKSGL